uniref:Uncharacterized protein n=1 Tax=Lepeophtheirus salmonis TaxID=72036 RepID=A0A0K2TVI9_LEPSM
MIKIFCTCVKHQNESAFHTHFCVLLRTQNNMKNKLQYLF